MARDRHPKRKDPVDAVSAKSGEVDPRRFRPVSAGTVIALVALLFSGFQEARYQRERAETRSNSEVEVVQRALTLGTRVSVFGARKAYVAAVMSDSTVPKEKLARGERLLNESDELEEEVMRVAAKESGVSIGRKRRMWEIDESVIGQLKERLGPRAGAAYRLGRLLGYCDDRVRLAVWLADDGRHWGQADAIADSAQFIATMGEVDSLVRVIGCPVRLEWSRSGSLWMRFAQGRAALDVISRWCAERDSKRRVVSLVSRIDNETFVALLLVRYGGAPAGYDVVMGPQILTRENEGVFDADFRRIAWLPRLPREARTEKPEHTSVPWEQ